MMSRSLLPIRPQRGITLIGVMIAIGVGIVIIGVTAMQFNRVRGNSKVQTEFQQLTALRLAVHKLFPSGDYSAVSNELIISNQLAPEGMAIDAAHLRNVWGGEVKVRFDPGTGLFAITEHGAPPAACADLVSAAQATFAIVYTGADGSPQVVKSPTQDYSVAAALNGCGAGSQSVVAFLSS